MTHHRATVDFEGACNFSSGDGRFLPHQLDDSLLILLSTFLSTVD